MGDDRRAGNLQCSLSKFCHLAAMQNFPKYGRGDHANADRAGRGKCCFNTGIYVDPVMHTRLMQIAPHATLILWDCGGAGPKPEFNAARRSYPDRLVFASLSAGHWQLIPNHDLGLPPPAIKPCILTPDERQRIQDCTEEGLRPTLLSFSGAISRSKPRRALKGLHNDKDILIYRGMKQSVKEAFNNTDFGAAYHLLSKQSQFGACPLGDNLFSYRFTEQLSCGTIPVVYADDWVLPFGIELVDWQDAVVLIREKDAARSAEILRMISNETKCAMRRRGVHLFDKYLREGREVIQGMVESLELEANRKHTFTAPIEEVRRRRNNQDSCSGTTARGSSTINDKTLCWDASVQRQWLSATSKTHPPAMLLLTNYGWQNPKARVRRRYHRSVRSRELTEGVVNHPWFHPGAYAKFVNGELPVHPSLTYYIFLDFETCEEGNYPNYLQGVQANLDTYGERAISAKYTQQGVQIGSIMKELGQVFSNVTWRVVYWDCDKSLPKQQWHPNLAVLSISASNDQDSADGSQGLPFPPYRTFNLSSHQRRDIESCRENDRPLLLSFSGHLLSRPRRMLQRLHNGNDVWISHPSNTSLWRNQSDSYFELALQSSFCAIPRGGSLGSSRLVEMMSAGCIPVIFADDWILPLRLIVNWTEVAVVIPEADVLQSVGILRSISTDQRCELRKRAFRVYEEYLSGGSEIVKGVIKGFESRHTLPGASPVGYKCTLMENGASQCVKALNEVEVALLA